MLNGTYDNETQSDKDSDSCIIIADDSEIPQTTAVRTNKKQEKLIVLFKAALATKRLKKLKKFIEKHYASLNFNATIHEETLFVHLVRIFSEGEQASHCLDAREILNHLFTQTPLNNINWNACFVQEPYRGMTLFLWVLSHALNETNQVWTRDLVTRLLDLKNANQALAPDWRRQINLHAQATTGLSKGTNCLWLILAKANKGDFFAKALLQFLSNQGLLKNLNWKVQNNLRFEEVEKNTSCFGLLSIYLLRNPGDAETFLTRNEIPFEHCEANGMKWELIPKSTAALRYKSPLIHRYIELLSQNIPWALKFIEKIYTTLPKNYNWMSLDWSQLIPQGPYQRKILLTWLLEKTLRGDLLAQSIFASLPLEKLEFNKVQLSDLAFNQLLQRMLNNDFPLAKRIFNLLLQEKATLNWQAIQWHENNLLQKFMESILEGELDQSLLENISRAKNEWPRLDWHRKIQRGLLREKTWLQWLTERALAEDDFARKVFSTLDFNQIDLSKVNWKVLCHKGPFQDKPLDVALFMLFFEQGSSLLENFPLHKLTQSAKFDWHLVDLNTKVANRNVTTIINILFIAAATGQDKYYQILKDVPIQPSAWKQIVWNIKIPSGLYQGKTLWTWVLLRAAAGEAWEKRLLQNIFSDIALSHFNWQEVDFNLKLSYGPFKDKTLLEWLILSALEGESFAKQILTQVNLDKFDWESINYNQTVTKGPHANQTLLSGLIQDYLISAPEGEPPLGYVLHKVSFEKLNFKAVSWLQKTNIGYSPLFALLIKAKADTISEKVLTMMLKEVPLSQFDWNEIFKTKDDEESSAILELIRLVNVQRPWAIQMFSALLEQIPITSIDWHKRYDALWGMLSYNALEALAEPYRSEIIFLQNCHDVEMLLTQSGNPPRRTEKLMERLGILALAFPEHPKLLYRLALLYKKQGDFENFCKWIKQIPPSNPCYEEANFTLANAILEEAQTAKGRHQDSEKTIESILDLILIFSPEKTKLLRQALSQYIHQEFVHATSEHESRGAQEKILLLEQENAKLEREKSDLAQNKEVLCVQNTHLMGQAGSLFDVNQTLTHEKAELASLIDTLKQTIATLEQQKEKVAEEKIEAIVNARLYESLWEVEKRKSALQSTTFTQELEKITKAAVAKEKETEKERQNPAQQAVLGQPLKKRYKVTQAPGAG